MTYVNKGSTTAIGVIFPILTILLLAIRSATFFHSRGLELDDILILPAAALTVASGVGMVVGAQMDIVGGHSLPAITPIEYEHLGKLEYAFWICHVLAIGFIKLSILFLFRRIFKGRAYRTAFDYANWTLIVCVILWTVVLLFCEIFACGDNPSLSWSSVESLRGDCMDTFALQTGCAVLSWVMDLAILVEPLFMIGSLNMKLQRKIQTSFIFLFSSFAVIAGLLRMIVWIQLQIQGVLNPTTRVLGDTFNTADVQGIISVILFWTYVEIGIGFLVACLPACTAILDRLAHSSIYRLRSLSSIRLFSSKSGGSRNGEWDHIEGSHEPKSWKTGSSQGTSLAHRSQDDIELIANRGTT